MQKARVHIVLPEDSLYKKNEKPATASIMLMLKPNQTLQKKEIKGIVNLAAHSIQGLQPENITIVDETGKILNDPDELDEQSVGAKTMTQLEMTSESGAICLWSTPFESVHVVCIEQESLPTGIEMPRAGQKLRPASSTVS